MTEALRKPPRAIVGNKIDMKRRAEIGQQKRARTRARILAATFELYGHENGLFTRVEEICGAAGVTRQTFYNHFGSMEDLREALTYEVTHDFLVAVTNAVLTLPDTAERSSAAIRFYIDKALADPKWGWSMVNISANGIIFGMETYRQAEQTVKDGIERGDFPIWDSRLGRDLILGASLSAVVTQLREAPGQQFTKEVTRGILIGMGVSPQRAEAIVGLSLPLL
jgi:AcrR family transcriptional regulator